MTKEKICYLIGTEFIKITGLHPKHKKTELKITRQEFMLLRDVMKDARYSQALNLLCQEIVEAEALSPNCAVAGGIEMDKLWDNQHIRDKYDKSKEV